MNELIKYFNEEYSKEYGKVSYPRTTLQIYRVYQAIKSYGINDDKLVELLHNVKLPKPKNTEEWELYVYCLYNMDDSESERKIKDISNKLEILPVKNTHHVIQDGVPVSQQNITLDGNNYKAYIFNDEQITIPDSLVLEDFENKFLAIASHSKGVLNAVISYNDGVNDITKEIELTRDENFTSNYFDYSDYTESSILNITFGFDYGINKFFIYVYYMKQPMKSPIFYEVKKVSLSYSYITNLLDDDYLKSIDYSKINNVPYKLTALVEGSTKTLKTGEYASLFDNLFIWDANKINERLDDTSGVKKNEYYEHNIKVKQKDSEGIGYGQYIPSSVMTGYKLFVSAGSDVIIKVYNRKTKELIAELSDFPGDGYTEIGINDSYSGTDGIFIAFTVKDSVKNFYGNTYVNNLILCKSSGFLTKQEVNNKVDKVNGKGLSTVDFTTAYETKLKKLENYNDTTIKKDIQTINTQLGDIAKKTIVEGNKIYLAKNDGTKLDEGTDLPSSGNIDLSDYVTKEELTQTGTVSFRNITSGETFTLNTSSETTETFGNVVLSGTSLNIDEGSSSTFTVKLDKAPTNNQIVTISTDNTDVTVSPSTITFTTNNYNTEQTITVNVAEDDNSTDEYCNIVLNTNNTNTVIIVIIKDNDEKTNGLTAVSNGLVHAYDFKTLTNSSATIKDLVGNKDIAITSDLIAGTNYGDSIGGINIKNAGSNIPVAVSGLNISDSKNCSVILRLKMNVSGSSGLICSSTTLDNKGQIITWGSGKALEIFNVTDGIKGTATMTNDNIYVIGVVLDSTAGTQNIVVNGNIDASKTTSNGIAFSDISLGGYQGASRNSCINYELLIYNRPLTSSELTQVYNDLKGGAI